MSQNNGCGNAMYSTESRRLTMEPNNVFIAPFDSITSLKTTLLVDNDGRIVVQRLQSIVNIARGNIHPSM
jgi:hypothetical protein